MKMRKNIIILATVATMIFSGCGEDRSHPKDSSSSLSPTPKAPLATFSLDTNLTDNYTQTDDGDNNDSTLYLRWFSKDDKLVFDGSKSRDLDSVGSGALSYDWIVKNEDNTTMSDSCIDQNATGSKLIIKICDEANDPEEEKFSVTLKVTDDDNQSSSSITKVRLY
jgi:hypothetical protein